jgi:hypothetical protein
LGASAGAVGRATSSPVKPGTLYSRLIDRQGIRKVLIDTADVDFPEYAAKVAPDRDAQGPLAFLGWPRCFADSGQPSRFLVYGRVGSAPPPWP